MRGTNHVGRALGLVQKVPFCFWKKKFLWMQTIQLTL